MGAVQLVALIGLTAGFPPTCLLAILGLVFFLVVRQWWGVLTAVVVIALQALAIAPIYLPDSAAGEPPSPCYRPTCASVPAMPGQWWPRSVNTMWVW